MGLFVTYPFSITGTTGTGAATGWVVKVNGVAENVFQVQASGNTVGISHVGGASAGDTVLVSYDGSADWKSGGHSLTPFVDEVSTNNTP